MTTASSPPRRADDAGPQSGPEAVGPQAELGDAWTSLTMSPHCDDETKYGIVDRVVADYQALGKAGGEILGRKVVDVNTVNGARVTLEDGSWVLVRASSSAGAGGGRQVDAGRGRRGRCSTSEAAAGRSSRSRRVQPGNLRAGCCRFSIDNASIVLRARNRLPLADVRSFGSPSNSHDETAACDIAGFP